MYQVRAGIRMMVILSMAGLFASVDSFLPVPSILPSQLLARKVLQTSNQNIHRCNSSLDNPLGSGRHQAQVVRENLHQKRQRRQSSSLVILSGSNSEDDTNNNASGVLEYIGRTSQPIVWISLYSLATTGHGLPAGPGGAIGAVEGIAYLVVVVLALLPPTEGGSSSSVVSSNSLARTLSRVSIAVGLIVLAGVAVEKGCVPNAKPILDYSAYFPVCSAD